MAAETLEALWTVQDSDGVVHRALRQDSGSITWVITACPWWWTHNVAGQKAPVRLDCVPTCLECTTLEIQAIGDAKCAHCGNPKALHNGHMHSFEAS